MAKNPFTPDSLREVAYGFQASRIFLTAYELGLFSVLGKEEATSNEVARRLLTDPRATDRLMNALVAMGLLEKTNGTFRNTATASRHLVAGSPDYLSGLMHTVHLWDSWDTLTEAVRQGGRTERRRHREPQRWTEAFIAAMNFRARRQAPIVAEEMALQEGMRILDVGGGSGAFSIAFVRTQKGVTATVFDLPEVLPLTKGYIHAEGLENRIDLVAGNYLEDELPSPYDLVFLSAIIHSNSPQENRHLVKKCVRALRPKGMLIVQDFIMDDSRTSPPFGAFFALNMLVGTEAGDTYTESEVRQWMVEAGLSDISKAETPFGVAQIRGKKRA